MNVLCNSDRFLDEQRRTKRAENAIDNNVLKERLKVSRNELSTIEIKKHRSRDDSLNFSHKFLLIFMYSIPLNDWALISALYCEVKFSTTIIYHEQDPFGD